MGVSPGAGYGSGRGIQVVRVSEQRSRSVGRTSGGPTPDGLLV